MRQAPLVPGKRWTLVAASAFLAGVLLTGLLATTLGGTTNTSPPAPTQHPARPVTPPTGEKLPSGEQGLPTAGPPVHWELFQRVALPYSTEAGPHQLQGAVAQDYQRSPIGALVAARQIDARHLLAAGQQWREVTEHQVLPGPGRDRYIAARSTVTDPTPSDDELLQTAGFRFITYTPNEAVIQLVSKRPTDGRLLGTTETVRWSENDWKLVLQPNGATSPSATPLADLTFYIPWTGV